MAMLDPVVVTPAQAMAEEGPVEKADLVDDPAGIDLGATVPAEEEEVQPEVVAHHLHNLEEAVDNETTLQKETETG